MISYPVRTHVVSRSTRDQALTWQTWSMQSLRKGFLTRPNSPHWVFVTRSFSYVSNIEQRRPNSRSQDINPYRDESRIRLLPSLVDHRLFPFTFLTHFVDH